MRNLRRLKCKSGASMTILGLWTIVFTLAIATLVVDMSKTMYIKSLYHTYAQKSVQTAIKQQDSIGGLKAESAAAAVNEYMRQRNPGTNTNEGYSHIGPCQATGPYPKITIKYDKTRKVDASSKSYYAENGQIPYIDDASTFYLQKYKAIQINIVDVTYNYFWSIFGKPCSEVNITVSGIGSSHYDEED